MNEMAKREIAVLLLLEAAVLSMFSCPPVDATNSTIPGCPTFFGCVCFSSSDVVCNGVPAIVTLPLARIGLQEVPKFEGVYENVRTIDLGSNSITRIPRASFTSTQFPSLVEIILIDNSISRIDVDAFQVSSLETLDLRENQLQEFTVGSFTQFTGPSFSSLHLEDNQIRTVIGVTRERFTRDFYPVLIIHLNGNAPPCEAEFFIRLCPFLEDGDAVCIATTTGGTELLTIQPDVCMDLNIPEDGPDSNPNVAVIIGGAVGGVLGIILVILLLVLLVVCLRLKMQPPTQPLISSPRHTGSPEEGPGATGGQEITYEYVDFPSRPPHKIPAKGMYYDSDGYILMVDSIPPQPPKQDKQVAVLLEGTSEGATPQAYETPITLRGLDDSENKKDEKNKPPIDTTNQDDKEKAEKAEKGRLEKSPSNDEKKEGDCDLVYLQVIT